MRTTTELYETFCCACEMQATCPVANDLRNNAVPGVPCPLGGWTVTDEVVTDPDA
jgi:hypothetical protein